MRQLITLIPAGRNRIIVIRRELPLTEDARWLQAPYRTKKWRVVRSVRPRAVSVAVAVKSIIGSPQPWRPEPAIPSSKRSVLHRPRVPSRPSEASRRKALAGGGDALGREERGWQAHCSRWRSGSRAWLLPSLFRFDRNRRDEAKQVAADGGDDLRFVLASGQQFFVASTQSPLRFRGTRVDFLIQTLQPLGQPAADPRFVLIGLGRFNDHTSEVRVPGFRDATALNVSAAGMFARDHAAVAHQLPGIAEPRQKAAFGHDTGGDNLACAAQCLQRLHYLLNFGRRCRDRVVYRFLQPLEAVSGMFHFMDVIEERSLQSRQLKMDLAFDPVHVLVGPILLYKLRRPPALSQKKFAQSLTRSLLIFSGIPTSSDQIADRFVRRRGDPHRRQITGSVTARQFLCVPPIRLHFVAGFHWDQAGRNHFASNTERSQLPVQHAACRSSLVARPEFLGRTDSLNQLTDPFEAVWNRGNRTDLPVCFRNRNRDRACVDIQSNKAYFRHATFRIRLCAAGFLLRSVTRVTTIRGWSPHIE